MARGYSIWVLRKKSNRHLLGAWTVKKEMVQWILKHDILFKEYQVLRFRDGSGQPAQLIPWEEIS